MAVTTNTVTSTTPVSYTTTTAAVAVVFSGQFRGASIRVFQATNTSPIRYQPLPANEGGLIAEPKAHVYNVGTGAVLRFVAKDIGSPIPNITLQTTDA
jgi:hypothetical protein